MTNLTYLESTVTRWLGVQVCCLVLVKSLDKLFKYVRVDSFKDFNKSMLSIINSTAHIT